MNRLSWSSLRAVADRLVLSLMLLWALTMIALPIVRWTLGDAALRGGIVTGVLVQVSLVAATLGRAWGARRTAGVSLGVACLAWLAEALGSHTGFPFGAYTYTQALQPQLLGVPLLIPLAWLMMLPPAWAVGYRLAQTGRGWKRLRWALASAAAFTAWDLFLDPQMVAWDFWRWQQPGGYFGVPWVNFAGWLLVSMLITLLVSPWVQPQDLPLPPLLAIYIITWLLQTIGQVFFWGLPGAGLAGFVGMGIIIGLALKA